MEAESVPSSGEGDVRSPSVTEFFVGRSVLVTGGTGFLGGVLVEKLLRSCAGLRTLYLLVRPKRGKEVAQRMAAFLTAPLFETLRRDDPQALSKVVPVEGELSLPCMGVSPSDWATLTADVSVVFHCAATVNFDEPLRVAVNSNLLGTRRVLEACRQMAQLRAAVHVSTCYSNCGRPEVEEIVYPPTHDPAEVIRCTEWMDNGLLEHLRPRLLKDKHPNTYTFTKALAESLVKTEGAGLPFTIVRPSIITSSWREPLPGWVDSMAGPTAFLAASSRGVIRTIPCAGHLVTDIVPVDMVANLLICAAWRTALYWEAGEPSVYNCSTGVLNPITWEELKGHVLAVGRRHASTQALWTPGGQYVTNRALYVMRVLLIQILPSALFDIFLRLSGREPVLLNIQMKLIRAFEVSRYFGVREWRFRGDNVALLWGSLQEGDREKFHLDVRDIDWREYVASYLHGIRTYIAREPPDTLPQAQKLFDRLYWINNVLQVLFILLLGCLCTFLLKRFSFLERATSWF